jgi:hypothetical protein
MDSTQENGIRSAFSIKTNRRRFVAVLNPHGLSEKQRHGEIVIFQKHVGSFSGCVGNGSQISLIMLCKGNPPAKVCAICGRF